MSEGLLLLFLIGLSGIINGFFTKYTVKDKKVLKKPSKVKSKVELQSIPELDMEEFNELTEDIQAIIKAYL